MKGYEIFEQRYLKIYRQDGIEPYDNRMGLLDFLRELNAGPEGIARYSSFMVVGIDDVLYLAKGKRGGPLPSISINCFSPLQMILNGRKAKFRLFVRGNWLRGTPSGWSIEAKYCPLILSLVPP